MTRVPVLKNGTGIVTGVTVTVVDASMDSPLGRAALRKGSLTSKDSVAA